MNTRVLFFIGLFFLIVAVGGLVLLSIPRQLSKESESQEAPAALPAAPPPIAGASSTPTITPLATPAAATTPGASTTAIPPSAGGFWHTVRGGETLFSMGRLYGVNPYAICSANSLGNCNYVWAGQMLWIPTGPLTTATAFSELAGAATATPIPQAAVVTPFPTATPAPVPTVMVKVDWPGGMNIDQSDSVVVSLARVTGEAFAPTAVATGHATAVSTLSSAGTPGAPLENVFGTGYKGFAIARLDGVAFDISPLTTESRSLEQSLITWQWSIAPKRTGRHVVHVSIEVQWKPSGDGGEIIQRQLWSSPLAIDVSEPLIARGQLGLSSLFAGLLGSGLSIPWLVEMAAIWRERRSKKGTDQAKHADQTT